MWSRCSVWLAVSLALLQEAGRRLLYTVCVCVWVYVCVCVCVSVTKAESVMCVCRVYFRVWGLSSADWNTCDVYQQFNSRHIVIRYQWMLECHNTHTHTHTHTHTQVSTWGRPSPLPPGAAHLWRWLRTAAEQIRWVFNEGQGFCVPPELTHRYKSQPQVWKHSRYIMLVLKMENKTYIVTAKEKTLACFITAAWMSDSWLYFVCNLLRTSSKESTERSNKISANISLIYVVYRDTFTSLH